MQNFIIGKIVGTQGLHGDVRVLPTTDDHKRFELLEQVNVFFNKQGEPRTLSIEKLWYHKGFVILKFEGVDDINAAQTLKGGEIRISRSMALPLMENEYYFQDIYDCEVLTEEGENLGTITDILQTGANDVYVVRGTDGKQILIPAIKECVRRVDVAAKRIIVELLPGLREL